MNYMTQIGAVWHPARMEDALRRYLNGEIDGREKFYICPGCKTKPTGVADKESDIRPDRPECTSVDNATVFDVVNAVCIVYGVTVTDIQGSEQSGDATAARRHAMWFMHKEFGFTYVEAGNELSRDGKSARQAIDIIEEVRRGKNRKMSADKFTKLNDEVIRLLGGREGKARG